MAGGDTALLAFRIAERRFAVEAGRVAEVVRPPALTRVPHAPASLAGVAALRGRVLPVVALGELIGVEARSGGAGRLIVLGGDEPLALAVDEVIGLLSGEARGLVETGEGAARIVPLEDLLASAFAGGFRRSAARRAAPERREPAAAVEARAEMATLLALTLAGQPYALPLGVVREVIAVPADVAALPRTDAAMLGVAHLRGALTPIVSARVLLGLPPAPLSPGARVVVVSVGDARVGLAVDQVSAILHAPVASIRPTPKLLNRGAGEGRVEAILCTAGGGLVAVLDPERLFAEESVAQILEDGRGAEAAAETGGDADEGTQRFLVFRLGDESYGMDIAAVEEVAALPDRLARVPKAPAYVLGVMSLRGAAVPVIDQRHRFGVGEKGAAARPRVIVVRLGELAAGFAVDAVTGILELPLSHLAPTPELTRDAVRLFDRVAQLEDGGRVILLVNPRELLDRAEQDLVAALARGAASQ